MDFKTKINGVLANPNAAYPAISYPNTGGKVKHYGDTLKFTPNTTDGVFTRPDGAYNMIQWHLHTPSEHRVDGNDYPAEVHFVHAKTNVATGKTDLAVIGAFVSYDTTTSPLLQNLITVKISSIQH